MKKLLTLLLVIVLTFCLAACGTTDTVVNDSYNIVGTKNTQYFAISSETLLSDLNKQLVEYDLSLSVMPSNSDMSVMLSENGESWKILLDTLAKSEITFMRANSIGNPKDWVGYVKEATLSTYSSGEETAKRNGQYIRALIKTFTPGEEEFVEDSIGLYGEPQKEAIIGENVYRVTVGTVSYTYKPKQNKFIVSPYDTGLLEKLTEDSSESTVIKPE